MNRQMALLKRQSACHTTGRKTVERFTDDRGARLLRRLKQLHADKGLVIESCLVTPIQIDQ